MSQQVGIVLISVIGTGLITFFITRHFREKRSLAYHIASRMSLINVNPEVRHKIKSNYDGRPTENIFSFRVNIINDGNVAIKEQPILFESDRRAKILEADYRTEPEREFGEITKVDTGSENEAKFLIGLLNPKSKKEQIEFNFLTIDNEDDKIKIHARGENLKIHQIPSVLDQVLALPAASFFFYVIFIALLMFGGYATYLDAGLRLNRGRQAKFF